LPKVGFFPIMPLRKGIDYEMFRLKRFYQGDKNRFSRECSGLNAIFLKEGLNSYIC